MFDATVAGSADRDGSASQGAVAIETVGLTKQFGRITAVDALDLTLPAGRIYGLMGPNGSGKTTLIRLLAGLARPTSGVARVLGVQMPSRDNLARIGYMTQADGIYSELSVVCFRHLVTGLTDEALDRHQDELQTALEVSGEGWLTTTRLRGSTWLRAGIVNYLSTEDDIDHLLDLLRRLGP